VEVLKRRVKYGLHQITRTRFKRIEEYWDPKADGLERLKVNRDVPAIYILLSKDVLQTDDPGYQPPGRDIPLLRSDRPANRRQHGQQKNRGATSSEAKDNGNKWKRRQRGGPTKDKKPAASNRYGSSGTGEGLSATTASSSQYAGDHKG